MKVSLSTPNVSLKNERNIKQQQSFGSVADFLSKSIQFMDANPQSSIALIDLSSMIMPRTLIDAKEKNIPAGLETFRRESSGLVINCLTPGILALGLAKLFKKSVLGQEFKHIPLDKLWANEETIDYLSGNWKKVQHLPDKRAQVEEFIKISFDKIQGADGAKNTVWRSIEDIPDNKSFYKELTNKVFAQKSSFSLDKDSLDSLSKSLTNKLGASKVISHADGIPLRTNLKDLIRDTYSMTKAFADDSVTPQNIDLFTSKAKRLLNNKSFVAMGLIVSLALFTQKINRYITEKQTGQKGYVGYKNIKNEKISAKEKTELTIGKIISGGGIAATAIATMGAFSPKMFQFSGIMPIIAQSRVISAITNIGRISAASDKTELKETTLREYLGFFNLYVLGDYVTKLTATLFEKRYKGLNIMNASSNLPKDASVFKKTIHWLKDVSIKSFDEIDGTVTKATKSAKFRKNAVAISQVSGLVYSCLALGIIVPAICTRIVRKDEQKRLANSDQKQKSAINFSRSLGLSENVKKTYSQFVK